MPIFQSLLSFKKNGPLKVENGIEGQNFNFIQILFDFEVDDHGFSLDDNIAIVFEIKTSK